MEYLDVGELGISPAISLRSEINALKSFFLEQIYVMKKSIEDSNNKEEKVTDSALMNCLKEQLAFLREENKIKNHLIQSLIDNAKNDYPCQNNIPNNIINSEKNNNSTNNNKNNTNIKDKNVNNNNGNNNYRERS